MRRTRLKTDITDIISVAVLIIGIVVVGVILTLVVRIQRGLLGIILGGLAVGLLAYWLREFRKMARKELFPRSLPKKQWSYELLDSGAEMTLVGEVPGPEENVNATVNERRLTVKGGNNFEKEVTLPTNSEILDTSYVNGVLHIKLRKL